MSEPYWHLRIGVSGIEAEQRQSWRGKRFILINPAILYVHSDIIRQHPRANSSSSSIQITSWSVYNSDIGWSFTIKVQKWLYSRWVGMMFSNVGIAIRELVEASTDLMQALATYFEGEKDPRNLMLVFSNLHIPMTEWDISGAAQVS